MLLKIEDMTREELLEVCRNREKFIDWVLENYPDAVSKYLGIGEQNEKCK